MSKSEAVVTVENGNYTGERLQALINSRLGVAFALGFGRALPPALGYRLAPRLADIVSSRSQLPMVQAARSNQWVIGEGELTEDQLDGRVRDTFRHTARCLYELYHNLGNEPAMLRLIRVDERHRQYIDRPMRPGQGLLVVAPHLSNFDFVIRAATLQGFRGLAVGFAQPKGGYRWQNELRRRAGLELLPASLSAMKKAAAVLKEGGTVLTGLDRPVSDSKHRVTFFGRPASLPVHHITLALRAEVPIMVVAVVFRPDGFYEILLSDPVKMKPYSNRRDTVVSNAERVLKVAEEYIRAAPEQWSMFYPVWPTAKPEFV